MTTRLSAVLVLWLAACRPDTSAPTLRVSMIPTTDPSKATREMQPLLHYLGKRTGTKVEITIPTNYAAVVEALVNDQVDVAHLGGFTYVQASRRAGVKPLVQRDRDREFHSKFVTQPKSPIQSLADLKRPALALDEAVFQRLTTTGKVDPATVRVFWTTPPFFDYVWVARKGLDTRLSGAVASAFLALSDADPQQKQILDALSAKNYLTADDASYDKLRQAAEQAGLLW